MKFEINNASVDLTKEQVEQMLKKFDQPVNRRFKPEDGQYYWYIYDCMGTGVCAWSGDNADLYRYSVGNCYPTKEKADKANELQIKITKLNDMIDEFNGDWVPDWSDHDQEKYILVYDHGSETVDRAKTNIAQMVMSVKHVKSEIDTIPENITTLFAEICEAINARN